MPHRDRRGSSATFTAHQLAALTANIDAFDPQSVARGRRYFADHRVIAASIDPPFIGGVVAGSSDYQTEWNWNGGGWEHSCRCPLRSECKHAVALALFALEAAGYGPTVARKPMRDRSMPTVSTRGAGLLAELRAARNSWDRHRPLQRLLAGCPVQVSAYEASLQELLEEKDPDLLCWQLAREIAARAGGWLPDPLEAYRKRPDLERQRAQRVRDELTRELIGWARDKRKLPTRHVRFVLGLAGSGDAVDLTLTVRLTTPRFNDEPRRLDQLKQLRSQSQRTAGTLPFAELSLLNTLFDGLDRAGGWYSNPNDRIEVDIVRRLLERAVDTDLIRWADEIPSELSERCGVTAGQPVRLQPRPVRVLPTCVDGDVGPRIELHCFFPDGESTAIGSVSFVRSQSLTAHAASLVVAKGCCWIVGEEPPDSLLKRFRDVGGLDIPAGQRSKMTGMLASHFEHVRPVLQTHTRFHSVQPLVALDLHDDWLQLRLFARGGDGEWLPGVQPPDGTPVFEYTPHESWEQYATGKAQTAPGSDLGPIVETQSSAPEPTDAGESPATSSAIDAAEIWLEAPDPAITQPLLAWLRETNAVPGDKGRPGGNSLEGRDVHVGWWLKASPARMQRFGEVWDRRPAGVVYLGNDKMRRLLSPAHRLFPKVKVKSSGVDFFEISAEWQTEGMQLTDADLARLRSATTRFVKLSSGWAQRDAIAARDETAEVFADLGIEVGGGEQTISVWQLAHAKPESIGALERMGADAGALEALHRLRDRIESFRGLPSIRVPRTVKADLRPYQKLGLDFLTHASSLGVGTILADDMGLGKTLQALTWLEHLRIGDPDGGPALVVCPTSVMHNWLREAERFTPKLRVLLIRSGRERHALWQHLHEYDLLVTNYALLRRDLQRWLAIDLRAAILDEAQNIKNPDADVSRAALQLKAAHRVALTGTPLENRALDLWSIVQFVNPGYLGNRRHFTARYDRLDAPRYVRALLAAKLRPILLRRMKKEVAPELPERIEERQDCELTAGQRKLYLAELQRSRQLVEDLAAEPDGLRRNRIVILAALTRLRQICCHPALAKGRASLGSGKFDALFELLEPLLQEGHKVLVFSQFVECLKLLRAEMQTRNIKQHLLTGQTKKREEVVRQFQDSPDPSVFLISLKAGGTGLNLTAASYVVVFDPWWNPAVEAQAIDRTHRIGQDRTVIAYRLLALGTIEEKIWELQQKKAALVRDVLGEDGFGRSLTREDLGYLLQEA